MLQYAVITSLIQFALHLMQIPDFAISKSPPYHNRDSSLLYGWCDTGGCCSFTDSSSTYTLLFDPKIWNFIPLIDRPVFVRLVPLESFDIVLLPQQWFLDFNSIIQTSSTELILTADIDTSFFSWHWFSCAVMFGAVSLLSPKRVTLMKLSSALFVVFSLLALLLVLFYFVFWYL